MIHILITTQLKIDLITFYINFAKSNTKHTLQCSESAKVIVKRIIRFVTKLSSERCYTFSV